MGGGGGGEGFRGGAVGAGEDIFPDDLQNITTPHPRVQVRTLGSTGWGQWGGDKPRGPTKVKLGSQDASNH